MATIHEYDPVDPPADTTKVVIAGASGDAIHQMLPHLKEVSVGKVWWGYVNPDIDKIVLCVAFSDPASAFHFKMKFA
jgi:hypothetical protein